VGMNREIALEQALIAVLLASKCLGHNEDSVVSRAAGLLLGNDQLRAVGDAYCKEALTEMDAARAKAKAIAGSISDNLSSLGRPVRRTVAPSTGLSKCGT